MTAAQPTSAGSPWARRVAWGLACIAVLGLAGLWVFNLGHYGWSALGEDFLSGVMLVLCFVGLGTLLELRQPANQIGWLLTAGGLTWLISGAASDFAARAVSDGHVTVALRLAASTLVVAALFQPLRRRVQAAVDRRFNRARYDAARIVEAFSSRLRQQVDLDQLSADLLAVVRQTLQAASSTLWLRTRAKEAAR